MVKRLNSDVVGIRNARGEALGRAVSGATEAASDCLTFELSGRRRQDARPARTMMNHTASRAWWPAVGAPLERRVRHRGAGYGIRILQRVGGGSGTTLQTSKASGLMPPRTVRYGPKHSMLSRYRRCQVSQSV